MGRIRTKLIKRIAKNLVVKDRTKFTKDFEKNKKPVEKQANIPSKKLRNMITGYVTKLIKKGQ
ncbi:MAG: 30S ribosomal protein S17e [Nanoarchaeota archaeon]|nr:30S ribosomal protein S17e [Nanoarchaeota archaeon]